ncbi:RadC family protein [Thalassotalea euphylliae]|uniref:JAB domain-containing protein n=1 Tax=Thalassotalea euphylliae TaxID=1655234 RepID=A0A3E0U381_9GAMM|nr:DNA repair protein RadC [Thalassotalea euphylliae]REL31174.1 JAB domain-containing protein [Thalassotalea euphylliae]
MLKTWPAQERPREKLLNQGAQSLSDAELLAIFLRTGVKGCSVVDLARQLLNNFGSIAAIYQASMQEFCQHHGLGQAKYVQLQACLEMSKRYLKEQAGVQQYLTSSSDTKNYLISELRGERHEVFGVVLLNSQHQVIGFERLFQGTIDAAAIYPRVVVENVLLQSAAAVILVHNHPSGLATPSEADQRITQRLIQALALIEVKVLDHLIIAKHQCYSFAEHGQL